MVSRPIDAVYSPQALLAWLKRYYPHPLWSMKGCGDCFSGSACHVTGSVPFWEPPTPGSEGYWGCDPGFTYDGDGGLSLEGPPGPTGDPGTTTTIIITQPGEDGEDGADCTCTCTPDSCTDSIDTPGDDGGCITDFVDDTGADATLDGGTGDGTVIVTGGDDSTGGGGIFVGKLDDGIGFEAAGDDDGADASVDYPSGGCWGVTADADDATEEITFPGGGTVISTVDALGNASCQISGNGLGSCTITSPKAEGANSSIVVAGNGGTCTMSSDGTMDAGSYTGAGGGLTGLVYPGVGSGVEGEVPTWGGGTNNIIGNSSLNFLNTTGVLTVADVTINGGGGGGEVTASLRTPKITFSDDTSMTTAATGGGAIETYNTPGATRIITSVNSSTVQGEENLTFDGGTLTVEGAEAGTGALTVTGLSTSKAVVHTSTGGSMATNSNFIYDSSTGAFSVGDGTNTLSIDGAGAFNFTDGTNSLGFNDEGLNSVSDPTGLDNDTGTGTIVTFGALGDGVTISAGYLLELDTDGFWYRADADDSKSTGLLAIALGASVAAGLMLDGFFNNDTGLLDEPSPGAAVFMSTTAGAMTLTKPNTSGDIVRIVGHCTNASNSTIYFNPGGEYSTVV